MKITS